MGVLGRRVFVVLEWGSRGSGLFFSSQAIVMRYPVLPLWGGWELDGAYSSRERTNFFLLLSLRACWADVSALPSGVRQWARSIRVELNHFFLLVVL